MSQSAKLFLAPAGTLVTPEVSSSGISVVFRLSVLPHLVLMKTRKVTTLCTPAETITERLSARVYQMWYRVKSAELFRGVNFCSTHVSDWYGTMHLWSRTELYCLHATMYSYSRVKLREIGVC